MRGNLRLRACFGGDVRVRRQHMRHHRVQRYTELCAPLKNARRARSGAFACSREVCAGGVCNTPSFLVFCSSVYTGGLPQNKAATVHINNTEERGFPSDSFVYRVSADTAGRRVSKPAAFYRPIKSAGVGCLISSGLLSQRFRGAPRFRYPKAGWGRMESSPRAKKQKKQKPASSQFSIRIRTAKARLIDPFGHSEFEARDIRKVTTRITG